MSVRPRTVEEALELFLEQRRREPGLDLRSFAAAHPELGTELLGVLESLDTLESLTRETTAATSAFDFDARPQLLRQVFLQALYIAVNQARRPRLGLCQQLADAFLNLAHRQPLGRGFIGEFHLSHQR